MSYRYEYTYPINNEAAGYSGPMPIEIATDTYVASLSDALDSRNLIRASIQRILGTARGERVMQPEFGSNLRKMLFEPLDDMLIEDIKQIMSDIIATQEPRIELNGIDFDLDIENHTIRVALSYKFRRTGLEDSFNFIIS